MNIGIFSGRLGRDAQLGKMPAGDAVLNFSLAVEVGTRDKPQVMWVEAALYGKRAESVAHLLTKGVKVTVGGRQVLDSFVGRDGEKKTTTRVTVFDLDIHLPPKPNSAPAQKQDAESFHDDPIPF